MALNKLYNNLCQYSTKVKLGVIMFIGNTLMFLLFGNNNYRGVHMNQDISLQELELILKYKEYFNPNSSADDRPEVTTLADAKEVLFASNLYMQQCAFFMEQYDYKDIGSEELYNIVINDLEFHYNNLFGLQNAVVNNLGNLFK